MGKNSLFGYHPKEEFYLESDLNPDFKIETKWEAEELFSMSLSENNNESFFTTEIAEHTEGK